MILGSVILASVAGLATFGISLATGNSFGASMALYSVVGTLVLSATVAWDALAPWLDGHSEAEGAAHRLHRPTES